MRRGAAGAAILIVLKMSKEANFKYSECICNENLVFLPTLKYIQEIIQDPIRDLLLWGHESETVSRIIHDKHGDKKSHKYVHLL